MKMIWHGTEIDLTVDELEEMYTRGLLGKIEFTEQKEKSRNEDMWDDLLKKAKDLPRSPAYPFGPGVVALYGCEIPQSELQKIDIPLMKPQSIQSTTVESREVNNNASKD